MNISVVGSGYVGLVTGACLAEKGHHVVCVDNDLAKVRAINSGVAPIHEKGLSELLARNIGINLRATTNLFNAVLESDVTFITVGTPFDGSNIDLKYIRACARDIGTALRDKPDFHLVVVKSTVVPGTTDEVVLPILETSSGKRAGTGFGVGTNPEFLREGEAVDDFMSPDRIILGASDELSHSYLSEVYEHFGGADKIRTNTRTAEMIKYASNCFFATLISFSNEIANLCISAGEIDVVDVMNGVKLDKRLSPITDSGERVVPKFTTYIEAGCGFGGSCFPKDLRALVSYGKHSGEEMQLLGAVADVNERQPLRIIAMLKEEFPVLEGLRVAVLGLAFKPGTDDVRESPSIKVILELIKRKAVVRAYDPVAAPSAKSIIGNNGVVYHDDLAQAIDDAQAILVLTRWEEFKIVPALLVNLPSQPLVIDGRRMLDKRDIARYRGIGLGVGG